MCCHLALAFFAHACATCWEVLLATLKVETIALQQGSGRSQQMHACSQLSSPCNKINYLVCITPHLSHYKPTLSLTRRSSRQQLGLLKHCNPWQASFCSRVLLLLRTVRQHKQRSVRQQHMRRIAMQHLQKTLHQRLKQDIFKRHKQIKTSQLCKAASV